MAGRGGPDGRRTGGREEIHRRRLRDQQPELVRGHRGDPRRTAARRPRHRLHPEAGWADRCGDAGTGPRRGEAVAVRGAGRHGGRPGGSGRRLILSTGLAEIIERPRLRADPTFAIAFGGGGARGLAHIHVIEALDELGIRPVSIAGSSIGAIMGAGMAAGMTGRDIHDYARGILMTAQGSREPHVARASEQLRRNDVRRIPRQPVQHRADPQGLPARRRAGALSRT